VLAGGVVAADDVQVLAGVGGGDLPEELEELLVPVTGVVVSLPFGDVRAHRQDRLGPPPLDHRRLGAPGSLRDLRAGHPLGGQQHDPGPLHDPGRAEDTLRLLAAGEAIGPHVNQCHRSDSRRQRLQGWL